jgi:hypothetical protein
MRRAATSRIDLTGRPERDAPLLVVVHPGSLCGSADFNLGFDEAAAARESLIAELGSWTGGVLIIDGALSDDLEEHPRLAAALDAALLGARTRGLASERVFGDDPDQVDRVTEHASSMGERAQRIQFIVTGAWFHEGAVRGATGCVGSVVEALQDMRLDATVSGQAAVLAEDVGPAERTHKDDAPERSSSETPQASGFDPVEAVEQTNRASPDYSGLADRKAAPRRSRPA